MRSITAGLCLSLIGGVALAQTPPAPTQPPKPPAAQPAPANAAPASPSPGMAPGPGAAPTPGMASAPGARADAAAPAGQPEGEIIETPDGFYLVRPGQGPTALDIRPKPTPPAAGDVASDMAEDEGQPPPQPQPRHPHPRPEGKGARFRIQTPAMTVGVKCPDDEPMKACVDAISGLLDKVAAQPHS